MLWSKELASVLLLETNVHVLANKADARVHISRSGEEQDHDAVRHW